MSKRESTGPTGKTSDAGISRPKTTDATRRSMRGPAKISLERPPIDSRTRKAMHEKYEQRYKRRREPQDIRHIVSAETLKQQTESRLNGMKTREQQVQALERKGMHLRRNASDQAINKAAQELLHKGANDPRNLFVGGRSENRRLKSADDTRIYKEQGRHKEQIRNALAYRKRYMAQKYLP